ncbi:hypothetical protein FVTDC_09810 [Fusobacterium vincentii]|nr:hypothetical protein FVTDC_09810 [Fusobacterium vincentii]
MKLQFELTNEQKFDSNYENLKIMGENNVFFRIFILLFCISDFDRPINILFNAFLYIRWNVIF